MPVMSNKFYGANFHVTTEYFALETCSTILEQKPVEVPHEVFLFNFLHCSISFIFLRFYIIHPIRRQRLGKDFTKEHKNLS